MLKRIWSLGTPTPARIRTERGASLGFPDDPWLPSLASRLSIPAWHPLASQPPLAFLMTFVSLPWLPGFRFPVGPVFLVDCRVSSYIEGLPCILQDCLVYWRISLYVTGFPCILYGCLFPEDPWLPSISSRSSWGRRGPYTGWPPRDTTASSSKA